MKTEVWMGHTVRFVEVEINVWWVVAKDAAIALGYKITSQMVRLIDSEEKALHYIRNNKGRKQIMSIISEKGIYEAVINSEHLKRKDFKKWVNILIKHYQNTFVLNGDSELELMHNPFVSKENLMQLSIIINHHLLMEKVVLTPIASKFKLGLCLSKNICVKCSNRKTTCLPEL